MNSDLSSDSERFGREMFHCSPAAAAAAAATPSNAAAFPVSQRRQNVRYRLRRNTTLDFVLFSARRAHSRAHVGPDQRIPRCETGRKFFLNVVVHCDLDEIDSPDVLYYVRARASSSMIDVAFIVGQGFHDTLQTQTEL